ncbi:MAG: DUF1127 domain-containing protein [Pseudorhodoplanes sp.]|nr:DUF1127 domain-containing protein [Pseudorhodoplanes sp.]
MMRPTGPTPLAAAPLFKEQGARTPALPAPARIVASLWRWIASCRARARQREALARVDNRLLADIGLTRREATREISKPFWMR